MLCAGSSGAESLREPLYDSLISAAMDRVCRMRYAEAESLIARIPQGVPARHYFSGLIGLNRFSDLGDTSALRRAENSWEILSAGVKGEPAGGGFAPTATAPLDLYRGLAELQRAYAASLRGSRLRAAKLAWSAKGRLRSFSHYAEAEAALALLDYYRAQFLERFRFLPFVNPRSDLPLRRVDSASGESRVLRDPLRGSLFWIRYDRGETDSALAIADGFLARYPGNRLARQMRGDALFRGGKLPEARAVYETLFTEYSRVRDSLPQFLPLGRACASGNLARIYSGLGMGAEAEERHRQWRQAERSALGPWLPASLRRELDRLPAPQTGH